MLFMTKSQFSVGRKVFLTNGPLKAKYAHENFEPFVIPHVEISLKWITKLNADIKITKFLEENISFKITSR